MQNGPTPSLKRQFLLLLFSVFCTMQVIAKAQTDSLDAKSLYHHAVYVSKGDKASLVWLKENNPSLYYYANYVWRKGDRHSLEWLKENNPALYHYANYVWRKGDRRSLEWLKENSPALYHYANYVWRKGDRRSLEWLKNNNQPLYHHLNYIFSGKRSSINWLQTH